MRHPELSLVIPTLNEAQHLPQLLQQLQDQRGLRLQVLVVDGGSSDATRTLARAYGARVLRSRPGRAAQMNRGAAAARAEWLCFLHADSQLPDPQLLQHALSALQAAGPRAAGHFGLRFLDGNPAHARFYAWLEAKSRSNRPGTIHGDQGFMLSRAFFAELGGFDTGLPIMEDEALAARVFEQGRWVLLPGLLYTSARRFEQEGVVPRYLLMGLMLTLWSAQIPAFFSDPHTLYPPPGQHRRRPLMPFLRQAIAQLATLPAAERERACRGVARYLLGNGWQLPAVLTGMQPGVLKTYDRWIAPLAESKLAEALTGRFLALAVGGRAGPT